MDNKIPSNEDILRTIENKILSKAGEKTLLFFLENYTHEGYSHHGTFVRWADRKKDTGKPILFKSGGMKRSFHIEYGKGEFSIMNTKPYSKYHNEGTEKLPQRPILYDDKKIGEIIEQVVFSELDKLFGKK